MALFRGIQEYIALDANNITLVFDSGNIVNISGNIFLYPPKDHPILYNYYMPRSSHLSLNIRELACNMALYFYPRAFRRKSGDYVIPFAVRPSVRPSVYLSIGLYLLLGY